MSKVVSLPRTLVALGLTAACAGSAWAQQALVPLILLAYTPLCIMCWKLKAGESVNNDPGEPV